MPTCRDQRFTPAPPLAPPRPEDRLPYGTEQLAPPRAEDRLPYGMAADDRKRLEVQAALTAAGVAPRAGDYAALRRIAALDDTSVAAVIGWIRTAAGRAPSGVVFPV